MKKCTTKTTDPLDGPVDFERFGPVRRRAFAGAGEHGGPSLLALWEMPELAPGAVLLRRGHPGRGTSRPTVARSVRLPAAVWKQVEMKVAPDTSTCIRRCARPCSAGSRRHPVPRHQVGRCPRGSAASPAAVRQAQRAEYPAARRRAGGPNARPHHLRGTSLGRCPAFVRIPDESGRQTVRPPKRPGWAGTRRVHASATTTCAKRPSQYVTKPDPTLLIDVVAPKVLEALKLASAALMPRTCGTSSLVGSPSGPPSSHYRAATTEQPPSIIHSGARPARRLVLARLRPLVGAASSSATTRRATQRRRLRLAHSTPSEIRPEPGQHRRARRGLR